MVVGVTLFQLIDIKDIICKDRSFNLELLISLYLKCTSLTNRIIRRNSSQNCIET
jgi:hypothetical protein